jgi:2-polyprenyl-6-hydroxyphenyl methylase / 3-demethylubiquinone-9 3-methyltransferase
VAGEPGGGSQVVSTPGVDALAGHHAYDAWHAEADYFDGDSPWHESLKPFLTDLSRKRVLEIGCGRGGFSVWLGTRPAPVAPAEVVAADFSAVAVAKAEALGRARGVRDVHYAMRDLTALEDPDESFDVVISCETIEHVSDSRAAVRHLARVLRPGGLLCLTFPAYSNLLGVLRVYQDHFGHGFSEGGQPINHWLSPRTVRRWLAEAGVTTLRVGGVGHYVPLPRMAPRRIGWLDALGPVTRWSALHQMVIGQKRPSPIRNTGRTAGTRS